jgi:hypothetical protein
MKTRHFILFLAIFCDTGQSAKAGNGELQSIDFDFFGNNIEIQVDASFIIPLASERSAEAISDFTQKLSKSRSETVVQKLLYYKKQLQLEDWLYYQLIRKTAQQISPKAENYYRYTLYKWFLLKQSGYDATLKTGNDKLLFYIQCDENIYNIPYYLFNGKQYVCLNYHDYGSYIDFEKEKLKVVILPENNNAFISFSYKISHLPEFNPGEYLEKELQFSYNEQDYQFKVKLNPQIKTIFANYPVVDYSSYFNIPLSHETYSSLIPLLKKNIKGMSIKNGVDYLMRFTRYAFLFKQDNQQFGGEKRLTPEQTLLFEQSDCDDRAALFFYLVKEIYNLPMIVLSYPEHVTLAVKFDKPVGKPIIYNGEKYSVCEPTPQKEDLAVGQLLPNLRKETYEVVYAYTPAHH